MKAMQFTSPGRAFLPVALTLLVSAAMVRADDEGKKPTTPTVNKDGEKVEWITVTGSHIKQKVVRKGTTYDTALPIHVIDVGASSKSGERTTMGMLRRQPFIFGR